MDGLKIVSFRNSVNCDVADAHVARPAITGNHKAKSGGEFLRYHFSQHAVAIDREQRNVELIRLNGKDLQKHCKPAYSRRVSTPNDANQLRGTLRYKGAFGFLAHVLDSS